MEDSFVSCFLFPELSFEDILRVRSTLGFVIDSFDSLQSEYARLAVPTIALPKPPTLKHNQLVWLPHHIGQGEK